MWLRTADTNPYLTPKFDFIRKLSSYVVFRIKVKMLTAFSEIDPETWHMCSMSPYPAVDGWGFSFSFLFHSKIWISHEQNIPKKSKIKIPGGGKKKNQRLDRSSKNVRAKFQGQSPKSGVDLGCWTSFGRYAWTSLWNVCWISARNLFVRNLIIHVIVELTWWSLVILPYGTMAAVENTSVISVLMYDCREHFLLFGGLWTLLPSPRIVFDHPAFGPPVSRIQGLQEKTVVSTRQAKLDRLML